MSADLPPSQNGNTAAQVARLCAQEAGRIIMKRFRQPQQVYVKGRGNLVTEADLEAERAVIEILRSEYPEHTVLCEETAGAARSDGWLWVVDPLDGTHNYSRGIPCFCFSIALCHDGEPLLALTYQPADGEEFFATKGSGALVNGQRACASARDSLRDSVLGIDLGYDDQRAARLIALLHALWPGMQSVRIMGSAALGLAYTACGRFDLFVHHMLYPWDVAAGILLVQEAGGAIVDRDGGPIGLRSEGAIAGAPAVVADFLRLATGKPWR